MINDWLLLAREPNLTHPEDAYIVLGPDQQRWRGIKWRIVAAGTEESVRAARRLFTTGLEAPSDL
jgi:hypothetical protein